MRTALRWTGYAVGALVVVALVAIAYIWFASSQILAARPVPVAEALAVPAAVDLAAAERRARTLGCFSCHGEGLRGKAFLVKPMVADLHATNLAELAPRVTDQQLARAIRQGIGSDGRALVVMPSEAYQRLTDAEVGALIRLIRSQPAGGAPVPQSTFSLLGRVGLVQGSVATAPELVRQYRAKPAADLGPATAMGRHLAITTCSGCHGSDLGGRQVTPDDLAPSLDIAGAYDRAAFTRLLREGVAPGGKRLGLMREAALNDARFYTDEEIGQIHDYLVARASR